MGNHTTNFIAFSLLILVSDLFFFPGASSANLDAPHDFMGCEECHDMGAYDLPNLIPDTGHSPLNIDDSLYNTTICWKCHDGSDPDIPYAETHSSLQTDDGYGNWTVECVVCHNQHSQEQDRKYGTTYGKFIRSRIDLTKILDNVPPVGTTVSGKSGVKEVKFIDSTGQNSFADGDAVIDGICEVCHTQTNHWRSDGSLAGQGAHIGLEGSNCTTCHPHDKGFDVDCDSCHGFPPVVNTPQIPDGLVVNPSPTGSTTAGVHATHIDKNYPCQYCHKDSVGNGPTHNTGDDTVTMGFSLFKGTYEGGTYNGQALVTYNRTTTAPVATTVTSSGAMTCENIFCHGRRPDGTVWGGGTNTVPSWNGTVACGDCHRATNASPPITGQHSEHTRPHNTGYNYSCSFCHTDPSTDGSLHGNNQSEVVFSSDPMTQGGTYNGDTDMLGSYGTCDNIYCHSTAQSSPPGNDPIFRTTPPWNSSMGGCDKCHYTWGSVPGLTTGSHDPHFFNDPGQQCYGCHNWEGVNDPCFACHDAFINPTRSKHANYAVNVEFLPLYGGTYNGTQTPGDAYGNCDNTYCHSNGTSVSTGSIPANSSPTWGSTGPLPCDSCHDNPPDYTSYIPKANDHGRHNMILNDNPTRTGYSCEICHYLTTTDGTSITNPNNHVNMQFEVSPSPTYPYKSGALTEYKVNDFTYTYDTGGGTCTNITCHGDNGRALTSEWGQTATMSVGFSYSTGTGCYGVSVIAGTPNCNPAYACQAPYTYTWDFGDGTILEGTASETHDYNTAGTFAISLNIKSATGFNETKTVPGVVPGPPPNIQPTIDKSISNVGLTATITDLSVDPDFDFCDHSGPAQIRIDWDDGTVEVLSLNLTDVPSNQTFQHTYALGGNYTITYRIWDNADTWWATSPNISITVP